jgi:hypothetical protein
MLEAECRPTPSITFHVGTAITIGTQLECRGIPMECVCGKMDQAICAKYSDTLALRTPRPFHLKPIRYVGHLFSFTRATKAPAQDTPQQQRDCRRAGLGVQMMIVYHTKGPRIAPGASCRANDSARRAAGVVEAAQRYMVHSTHERLVLRWYTVPSSLSHRTAPNQCHDQ